ncbi:unnamed protein product [Pleuronectes platessa]|uniref:Uncharacterized protein n=1 Tax=Pleuronectes platessa TaxID=8262 RepID=A0A9N7TWL1_PLEPL|nr:unnamed protein product [Pleuronectes platessa]
MSNDLRRQRPFIRHGRTRTVNARRRSTSLHASSCALKRQCPRERHKSGTRRGDQGLGDQTDIHEKELSHPVKLCRGPSGPNRIVVSLMIEEIAQNKCWGLFGKRAKEMSNLDVNPTWPMW